MPKLAINGGPKIREHLFPSQNTMGEREMDAVTRVMKEGRLSGYRGSWCPEFFGGPEIQALEKEWKQKFNVKHAIAVNSCTSGLHVACGAVGLKPNDEVIVTPYSMTCSATAPMIYGAIPVFADVEYNNYCIDPKSVEERITEKTKAIIAVSIFGQPYDIKINEIARDHNLFVIEDAAQALGSYYKNYAQMEISHEFKRQPAPLFYAGTLGDIGVYSFNYGKHINCGEGGMIVTNDDNLAMRCRLIANHAEAVVNDMQDKQFLVLGMNYPGNLVGFNMRMTELQAAVLRVQLQKLDSLQKQRTKNVKYFENRLCEIPAIETSTTRKDCTHVNYVLAFKWHKEKADGLHRDKFIAAVKAELTGRHDRDGEGVPIGCGYIKPLYLMPLFQNKKEKYVSYRKGICPVVEKLYEEELFLTLYHAPNSRIEDCKNVTEAFFKVWTYREELL